MKMAYQFLLLWLFSLSFIETVAAKELSVDIMERIIKLENSDNENKREIASMKIKMIEMDKDFLKREKQLLQVIDELQEKLEVSKSKEVEDEAASDQGNESIDRRSDMKTRRSSIVRETVETEVAFYATHSNHDILHLGKNQIIAFNHTVTNIGNAYNTHHGAFVAPVDGTYVFHVTLMGTVHNTTHKYYVAYIDVDDVAYSEFYIIPYEQSSHMLVIELKSGSTVSVKNGHIDDGVVGRHYSAFSGFLLYQHYQSSAIVGK